MPRSGIQVEQLRQFEGGLNLSVDPVDLGFNETFDLQNIDLSRRGGFGVRRGIKKFINADITATPKATYTFVNSSGTPRITICNTGYRVLYWDGAAWQQIKASTGGTFDAKFVEMRNELYIINAAAVAHKWDGVAAATTALVAPAFNDDLTAPNDGNFLQCHTAAVHKNVMWVGNIVNDPDGATNRPSRIRWSHPGKPEDWRTDDWIDLDPDDENGAIRAMVPFADRLLVFKDHAVYAIHGDPPASFSVENVSKQVGASSNGSVVATEAGVFFWDSAKGAFFYDGRDLNWIFAALHPLIEDKIISTDMADAAALGFHNDRLYCVVRWLAEPYNSNGEVDVALVFAPRVGKGAWMVHAWLERVAATNEIVPRFWPRSMHVHQDSTNGEFHLLASPGNIGWIMEVDTPNLWEDQRASSSSTTDMIIAHYTTRWFDARDADIRKSWKRPTFVVRAGSTQTTTVDVLTDYDPSIVDKTFSISTTAPVGNEGEWDVSDWDEVNWANEGGVTAERSVVLRGAPLGSGIAKSLRLKNTVKNQDWRIHALAMKYILKRRRN